MHKSRKGILNILAPIVTSLLSICILLVACSPSAPQESDPTSLPPSPTSTESFTPTPTTTPTPAPTPIPTPEPQTWFYLEPEIRDAACRSAEDAVQREVYPTSIASIIESNALHPCMLDVTPPADYQGPTDAYHLAQSAIFSAVIDAGGAGEDENGEIIGPEEIIRENEDGTQIVIGLWTPNFTTVAELAAINAAVVLDAPYVVQGNVFEDLKLNGLPEGQTPIAGVHVCYEDELGNICAVSDPQGNYFLPITTQFDQKTIFLRNVPEDPLPEGYFFWRINTDVMEGGDGYAIVENEDWPTQRLPVTIMKQTIDGLLLRMDPDNYLTVHVGLSHGAANSPFFEEQQEDVNRWNFLDRDPRDGSTLNWRGETDLINGLIKQHIPVAGETIQNDNHPGTDWGFVPARRDIYVVAMTSGNITDILSSGVYSGDYKVVRQSTGLPVVIEYGHLYKIAVEPGEEVLTGQIIGIMGKSGDSQWWHLHINFMGIGTEAPFGESVFCLENPLSVNGAGQQVSEYFCDPNSSKKSERSLFITYNELVAFSMGDTIVEP